MDYKSYKMILLLLIVSSLCIGLILGALAVKSNPFNDEKVALIAINKFAKSEGVKAQEEIKKMAVDQIVKQLEEGGYNCQQIINK